VFDAALTVLKFCWLNEFTVSQSHCSTRRVTFVSSRVGQCTLPCNLSLMACFADITVLQGSVATYARCVHGSFNIHLTTNLPRSYPVKKVFKVGSDLTELWS